MVIPGCKKLIVAYLLLLVVESIPVFGAIVTLCGGGLAGLILPHAILFAIFIDAYSGRLPRYAAVIPLLAYGAYYGTYVQETWDAYQTDAQLRSRNPGKVIDFDPSRYALVDKDAHDIVAKYAVPVAYEPDDKLVDGYRAYRVVHCPANPPTPNNSPNWLSYDGPKGYCIYSAPERPALPLLTMEWTGDKFHSEQRYRSEYQIRALSDGELKGIFTRVEIRRLTLLPLFMTGQFVDDSRATAVLVKGFATAPLLVDGVSPDWDADRKLVPQKVMLGLQEYTGAELERIAFQNEVRGLNL